MKFHIFTLIFFLITGSVPLSQVANTRSVPLSQVANIGSVPLLQAENTGSVPLSQGTSITLDGEFSDWDDKPNFDPIDHPQADDNSKFKKIAWYADPDDGNLYFYCRSDSEKKKWSLKIVFETDEGSFDAYVDYDSDNDNVSVELEKKGQKPAIWKRQGSWGRTDSVNFTQLEFAVPMEKLIGELNWGYSIRFRFLNGSGQAPKNSWFTVNTISTFPFIGIGLSVVACIAIPWFLRRKKCTY